MNVVRARLSIPALVAGLIALASAPAALADSSSSSNWAGYAVHRAGVKFQKVEAAWTQPVLHCTRGYNSYSAFWVGLGGFSENSQALEQVGTEADCRSSGKASDSAWYELVPAPSKPLKLKVSPGDMIAALVQVDGHQATLELYDTTSHKSATKTLRAGLIDVSSAEWIAEAPSDCISANSCDTLPLANFGSTSFSFAAVKTTTGILGGITNKDWKTTKITLEPGHGRFIGNHGGQSGSATPSSLTGRGGTTFTVTYATLHAQGNPFFAADIQPGGHLVHSGR
jgi:hypothetical protein